jgi:hypothetical protein
VIRARACPCVAPLVLHCLRQREGLQAAFNPLTTMLKTRAIGFNEAWTIEEIVASIQEEELDRLLVGCI